MAQNVTVAGASYSDVPAVELPKTGGGTATFYDADFKTVTMNLTSIASSANDTRVENGNSFFTRLAPTLQNYVISEITVTMGGVDVTSQVFHPDEGGGGGADLGTKTITQNGTYNASSDGYDGYSQVTVNVQGGVTPTGTKQISISTNGTTTEDVTNYASAEITVNVPTGTARSSSDLTVSGATVTAPAGLYASAASKSVASGTAGTPTATKGTVSNHSVSVTPSVTNTTGYITGSTKTGTAVTVTASELVSGNKEITSNGTNIDVANYSTVSVAVPSSGANFATATMTNSSNQAQSISFTLASGRTPKAFFARLTSQIARNSSSRYYYVFDMRWDGSSTGGVAGNTFYMSSGTLTNVTSGYSHSQSGTTFTLSTTGTRSTSPGSFYNGTYELVYVY